MDGKASTLLQMLSTLQGACHSHQEQAKPQGEETETTQGMEEQTLQGLAAKMIQALPCTCPWKREGHLSKRKGLEATSTQELTMHEAMEEGGTWAEEEGWEATSTQGAAMHEHMEDGRDNCRRGSCGPNDLRHLPVHVALLQANHMTDTGVFMLV
jgi:hypothetical protein